MHKIGRKNSFEGTRQNNFVTSEKKVLKKDNKIGDSDCLLKTQDFAK